MVDRVDWNDDVSIPTPAGGNRAPQEILRDDPDSVPPRQVFGNNKSGMVCGSGCVCVMVLDLGAMQLGACISAVCCDCDC